MKPIIDNRLYKEYRQGEMNQKSWIEAPKEAAPDDGKGKLLYSNVSWTEYRENYKDAQFRSMVYFSICAGLLLLAIVLWDSVTDIGLLTVWFIILGVFGVVWYLEAKLNNWFAVFENGIQPRTIPLRRPHNRRFFPYSEMKSIEIVTDEVNMEVHEWEFLFTTKDGYSFSINHKVLWGDHGERLFQILKSLIVCRDEMIGRKP